MAQTKEQDSNGQDFVEEPEEKPEKPTVHEDDEGGVTVSMPEAKKPTRKERRQDRQSDEVSRHREEAAQLRAEIAQRDAMHATRIAQLEARLPQTDDPHEKKQQAIIAEQESIQMMIRQAATVPEAERLKARFYALNKESAEIERTKLKEEIRQEMRQYAQQPAGAAEEAILRAEFPDVLNHVDPRTGDRAAIRWAKGHYDQLLAKGEPPTLTTQRKALAKAAEEFGLRQLAAPAPTPSQQQRFGSLPAQAGARGGGVDIHLDGKQKRMALARWPQLDEHEAYKRMATLMRGVQRDDQQGDQ